MIPVLFGKQVRARIRSFISFRLFHLYQCIIAVVGVVVVIAVGCNFSPQPCCANDKYKHYTYFPRIGGRATLPRSLFNSHSFVPLLCHCCGAIQRHERHFDAMEFLCIYTTHQHTEYTLAIIIITIIMFKGPCDTQSR